MDDYACLEGLFLFVLNQGCPRGMRLYSLFLAPYIPKSLRSRVADAAVGD